MADTTLFALTAFTSGADGDVLPAVDVSDTAQSAQGSTRKITFANLKTYMSASPSLVTPALGTPSSGALTNCTAVPAAQIVGVIPMANLATGTPDGTKFIRDDGTLVVPSGAGDVAKVGTPVDGQVGVWTGDGTIEGDAALSFDTTTDLLTVGAGSLTRAGAHALTFTTTGTTNVTFPTGGTVYTSGGSGADVAVTDGGTGRSTSTTAYGLIAAGTTATGAHQTLAAGATTEVLVGGGASSLPVWTTASGSGAPVRATSPTLTTPTLSGIYTSDGASVTTASAMGALAIDVTKGLNTKSISTESTFTFSGTPATANTWFGVHITNSDTAPHIITFPSAFSQVTQAARTTCPIAASGQLFLMFRYDGSAYKVFGDSSFFSKFDATTAPAVTDDLDLGYGAGSLWLDATGNAAYICESAANGAAVWHSFAGALDADLTTIAGLTATTDNFLQAKSSAWASRTVAQVLTDLQGTGSAVDTAGFRGLPQNSQSAAYTTVLADAGKHLYHPGADTTARTFTIDSNANVAYPVGTTLTFVNDTSAGVITIAITSDTLVLAGAGTTGSRTLAANGIATAVKMTSTRWMINGTGLT